ncbi:MAG: ABC transporter ATP-binding protein/permease [Clostridia bacterium]|nr:ABC transporter ATP-binding protein/permease [Clostridia bacterium]
MLQLYNINKHYVTGSTSQAALNNLNLSLRDNEFVAILGPSGSGKTTLLNIVGGLDRYDSGDLIINGASTKHYGDREWDSYRNHTIGFVFQSYNLIPHQSVLSNVELALTISGVSRAERRERAIKALEQVGLADHIHKKPNQMSGGQMQRVAIARALVNNPDILLADEPTGALDSDTSIQVMELLKEVAKDRLVVMVTHNPELAEEYANRIVRLKDGTIVEDTNPYNISRDDFAEVKEHNNGKASMSFLTALSLSFNNLKTKLARTLLTSFAGSIGIIGIAMILALSSGVNSYISGLQKDMMTAYPITISGQTMDTTLMQDSSAAMAMMGELTDSEKEYNGIYAGYSTVQATAMMNSVIKENDLTAFKEYIENPSNGVKEHVGQNGIVYSYNMSFDVYSYDNDGNIIRSDADYMQNSETASMMAGMGFDMSTSMSMLRDFISSVVGTTSTGAENFSELLPGSNGEAVSEVVKKSYKLLHGRWPENHDEVVLVLDYFNAIDVSALYQLGMITDEQYRDISKRIESGENVAPLNWDYTTLCNHSFYLVPSSNKYVKNEDGTFNLMEDTTENRQKLLETAIKLKITGVIKPDPEATNATILTPVAYTSKLTDYLVSYADSSEVVKAQQATPDINVLTGTSFGPISDEEKIAQVRDYLTNLSDAEKTTMYTLIMMLTAQNSTDNADGDAAEDSANTQEEKSVAEKFLDLIGISKLFSEDGLLKDVSSFLSFADMLSGKGLDKWLENDADNETLLYIYDEYLGIYTYESNLSDFGKISYDHPSAISIYTDSFEEKEAVTECISTYNASVGEDSQIVYTDTIAMITDSITSIVDVVSYVLIAFVAVSLVVSSIMIGIITYISVLERTKEIGILRSIGASKANISQVFNAETLIIGLCSGALGIIITELTIIPINTLIHSLTGNVSVSAELPLTSAIILIALSVTLTLVGGLIPSRKASKKDPVTALRSE